MADDVLVIRDCLFYVLGRLVKYLADSKVRRDIVGVDLQGMLEVLLSFLRFSSIGLECCEMYTSTKVDLVDDEALLEELNSLLIVLLLLMNHTQMVIGVDIGDRLLKSLLEASNSLLESVSLLKDTAHAHQGVGVVLVILESSLEVLF